MSVAAVLALAVMVVGCRGGGDTTQTPSEPASAAGPTDTVTPTDREIVLFFPSSEDELLHAEKRTVIPIAAPEDRAKQVLEELLRGPSPPLLAAIPDGVHVRQIYLMPDGTAYADLSAEMLHHRGGSLGELQTIYAIVDTLALNVREIRRIGILVDGKTRETLAGHVDITEPLKPNYAYVEASSRPAMSSVDMGAAGATGNAGATAATGATGEASPNGATGASGAPGASGDADATLGEGDELSHEADGTVAHSEGGRGRIGDDAAIARASHLPTPRDTRRFA